MNSERVVDVGAYPLRLPEFWHEHREVRERPGYFGYNAIATPGVTFDFGVIVGPDLVAEERERLVAAYVRGKGPERHIREEVVFQGFRFDRHRLEECRLLGPGAVYELFVCDAYEDTLSFGYGFTAPNELEESLQHFFLTMVTGAIVDRGYALHAGKRESDA